MTTLAFRPPVPEPPDDPRSQLLDSRTGWRGASFDHVIESACGALVLASANPRSAAEPSGSFGGLTPPRNVGLAADGDIYLLDPKTLRLKRFDACGCRFDVVPCIGDRGPGPRQFDEAQGIGICSGSLYVCDTANHRVASFALPGFALRGFLAPPAGAMPAAWEPVDIAFDGRGRIFVSDRANGCVHVFNSAGVWRSRFDGLGTVSDLAIDCLDRIYVAVQEAERTVRVLDADGHAAAVPERPETLAPRFAPLPFDVDSLGRLHLQCPDGAIRVFDPSGEPVTEPAGPMSPVLFGSGTFVTAALDSDIYRCQWHRIVLRADVPAGARIRVTTFSADALQSDDQILALPDQAWETNQVDATDGGWDCLVRSGPGRYLWLRLTLEGNGTAGPAIEQIILEFPRISLSRFLPAVFVAEPVSADFTDRLLSVFDTTLRSVETEVDRVASYFDPLSAPAHATGRRIDFLTWLASWIGVSLDRHWPEAMRRRFLKDAGKLFDLRGTRRGLHEQLLFLLGMEPERICCAEDRPALHCSPQPSNCAPREVLPCAWQPPPLILEHFALRRWLFVGSGRLGAQAAIWGRRIVNRTQLGANAQVEVSQLITKQDPFHDPFHVFAHTFTVFVPACVGRSARLRKALENMLRSERPAHTKYSVEYVEPRFRIGVQSMIGLDAVVGRYPVGVTLDATALGAGSVLGRPWSGPGGPGLAIGSTSRIGAATLE